MDALRLEMRRASRCERREVVHMYIPVQEAVHMDKNPGRVWLSTSQLLSVSL
jgi:hypothetical protein